MQSIFDLKTKKEDLSSSNQGISKAYYDEVLPLRNVSDSSATNKNFGNGEFTFRWNYGSSWWIPSRSYFVLDVELSKADAASTLLEATDDIAPAMNPCSCLFSKLHFKINDRIISEVSELVPQVQNIKQRISKTGQWLNTTGANLSMWEADFESRQSHVTNTAKYLRYGDGSASYDFFANGQMDNTTTLALQAADHVATFVAPAPDMTDYLQTGDLLVFRFTDEVFQRALWVASPQTALTFLAASFGTTIANKAATAIVSCVRYRYDMTDAINMTSQGAVNGQLVAGANNVLTYGGNEVMTRHLSSIKGSLILLSREGDTITQGYMGTYATGRNTLLGASFNVNTQIAAGGGNLNQATQLRYASDFVLGQDLGFVINNQANGHAVDVAANAQGDAILTITRLGTAKEIPDVNTVFKVGDFVAIKIQAGGIRYGLVSGVDPDENGRSLNIIGEAVIGAAFGANNDGQNFIYGRWRLRPAKTEQLQVQQPRNTKRFQVIWQPPLSIFDIPHGIPACGKFEIAMTPFSDTTYQKYFIESVISSKTHTTTGINNDYKLLIKNMKLRNLKVDGPLVEKQEFFLDLNEVRCQSTSIDSSARTQYNLTVSPSTYALTVAFQDSAAGSDTRYSLSKLKIRNEAELNLTNFYIRYGGLQKPVPDYELEYNRDANTDTTIDLYARNIFYDGSVYDSSKETLAEFRDRGMYMHFPWPRDGTMKETRVYISTQFSEDFSRNPRLMVFNHFKKVAILKIDNGALYEVIVNEA